MLIAAEALKAMEKVASHINEMQKIYEDYGAVFDQLVAEQSGADKEVRHQINHVSLLWYMVLCVPAGRNSPSLSIPLSLNINKKKKNTLADDTHIFPHTQMQNPSCE